MEMWCSWRCSWSRWWSWWCDVMPARFAPFLSLSLFFSPSLLLPSGAARAPLSYPGTPESARQGGRTANALERFHTNTPCRKHKRRNGVKGQTCWGKGLSSPFSVYPPVFSTRGAELARSGALTSRRCALQQDARGARELLRVARLNDSPLYVSFFFPPLLFRKCFP